VKRRALIGALFVLALIITAVAKLHFTASRAVSESRAAHARGEFLVAVLRAEEAARAAPIPPASEGLALLSDYAAEAEKNKDAASTAAAWQSYERALASTGRLTGAERTRIHEALVRARSTADETPRPAGEAPLRLPDGERDQRGGSRWLSDLVAAATLVSVALFVRRPSRLAAAASVAFGLVFAGLGFLV
jgi:hypothetical protein